jgi:hypothetical protein
MKKFRIIESLLSLGWKKVKSSKIQSSCEKGISNLNA